MDTTRLQFLFERQTAQTLTEAEGVELHTYLADRANEVHVKELIATVYQTTGEERAMDAEVAAQMLQTILRTERPVKRIPLYQRPVVRGLVAACVIGLLALSGYWLLSGEKAAVMPGTETVATTRDVEAPKVNRASLTLADGKVVYLDESGSGTIAQQGDLAVQKLADGQVIYRGTSGEVAYHTLTNPRGSKVISLTLSDGTKVWLNAESSLRYPAAFSGRERKVEITGEGYFEVAKNAAMPFIVQHKDVAVQVLGTHFNVNSYEDESALRVTLLEGSVRVNKGVEQRLLRPGQQADITTNIAIRNNIDLQQVMAWKNGFFFFKQASLETVLRELARWYDVQVVYEGAVPNMKFGGDISRDSKLSEVLKILEESKVKFTIEGRTITVK